MKVQITSNEFNPDPHYHQPIKSPVPPTPEFEKTAEQTLKYLVKTLYSEELGVFLSFQEADTFYYFLNAEGRSQGKTPEVIQRIFTDRLSRTLLQLMAIEGIPESFQLDQKILSSLDFLASMVIREKQIYHFLKLQGHSLPQVFGGPPFHLQQC